MRAECEAAGARAGCVIVLGGDPPGINLLTRFAKQAALIIAADSGAAALLEAQITPGLLVGDMDSLPGSALAALRHVQRLVLPTEKDKTDGCAALDIALERGYRDITLLGALGGRLDHLLGNIMLLARALDNGATAQIIGESQQVRLLGAGMSEITGRPGQTLSLIPWGGDALVRRSEGLKYRLCPVELSSSYPIGVSNELTGEFARLWVERGRVLVVS